LAVIKRFWTKSQAKKWHRGMAPSFQMRGNEREIYRTRKLKAIRRIDAIAREPPSKLTTDIWRELRKSHQGVEREERI
jgi:hypothetical protein